MENGMAGMWGDPYPIDLIQIVRLENDAAHDTSTRSRLHGNRNITKENVEVGLNGGSITLLVDGEGSTVRAGLDSAGSGSPLIQTLGEVEAQVGLGSTLVSGASLLQGVARSISLSRSLSHGEGGRSELVERRHGVGMKINTQPE